MSDVLRPTDSAPPPDYWAHGVEAWFLNRRRNGRRVARLSVVVGLVMLAPLLGLRATPLGRQVRQLDIMRFGFAGPPRFVELMQVDAIPGRLEARDLGKVVTHGGLPGDPGHRRPAPPRSRRGALVVSAPGAGDRGDDLVARAIASRGAVPVIQSSDLIIEELVRPEYPEDVRARGIEGHVAVLAHVDTLGAVVEAQVMNPSGEARLDESSLRAVQHCRFRPYRSNGRLTDVYAVFRFAFRIY